MFSTALWFSAAATLLPLLSKAEVVPITPSSLDTYNVGAQCQVVWTGDADPATKDKWKNMSIQLMTGDNFGMVHLTTVAMDQDGSVDGSFQYTCPDVTPNSMIYFYQFRSPWIETAETQWTTRFTIASATGEVTEPSEETDGIQWGTGALVNPSSGTPAPDFSSYEGGNTDSASVTTGAPPTSSSSAVVSDEPTPEPSSSSAPEPSAEPSGDAEEGGEEEEATPSPSSPSGPSEESSSSSSFSSSRRPTSTGTPSNSADGAQSTGDEDGALSTGASAVVVAFASLLAVYAAL